MNKPIILLLFLYMGLQLSAMEVCPLEPQEKILFINDCPIQIHLELMLKKQPIGHHSGYDYEQAVQLYSYLESYEIKEFHWLPAIQWCGNKQQGGHYIHLKKNCSSPSFEALENIIASHKKHRIKWINVDCPDNFMSFIRAEDCRRKRHNEKALQFSAGVGTLVLALTGWYLVFGEKNY